MLHLGLWMRLTLALTTALVFALLMVAYAIPDEWVPRGKLTFNYTVFSAVLSPSGDYLAVVYGDNYRSFLSLYGSGLEPLWTRQLAFFSSVRFVDDSLLVAVEQLYGSVPSSRVTLLDAKTGREKYVGVIRGGVRSPEIVKAVLLGDTLYVLTKRELVVLSIATAQEPRVVLAFANAGLQMLRSGEKLIVLSIDTNCHICLMNNERALVVLEPDGMRKSTLYHVLLMVNLGEKAALLSDNGTLLQLSVGNEISFSPLYALSVPAGRLTASEPNYRLLYSLTTEELSVRLTVVDAAKGRVISSVLPLPYEKGDELGLRGFDDGSFVVWSRDTVVVGNAAEEVKLRVVKPGFAVTSVDVRDRVLTVAGTSEVMVYDLKAEPTLPPQIALNVLDEQGAPVSNYTVILDGQPLGVFTGSLLINTSSGPHRLQVLAPGFQPAVLDANVSGRTNLLVVLKRVRFKVSVQAEEFDAPQPEILLVRNSSVVARGVGALVVQVPPGSYEVRVVGRRANATRTLDVRADLEVFIYLVPYPVEVAQNESSGKGGENAVQASNLTVVIYGSETCPSCREVKERLEQAGLQPIFREISNRSNLETYYQLYETLKAGSSYVIPLTLIFQGKCLVAAAAGDPRDPAAWRNLLSAQCGDSAMVIRDDGSMVRVPVNASEVFDIVFGGSREKSLQAAGGVILGAVLALAAADSINPCTFMVFAALLLSVAGISGRGAAAKVAVAFVAAVFISYFLLGLGLVNFVGYFSWARYLVGAAAVLAGGYEASKGMRAALTTLSDIARAASLNRAARFVKRALSLEPLASRLGVVYVLLQRARSRINKVGQSFLERARKGSVVAGAAAGVLVSFTLLPCSSGPYLVASYMLSGLPLSVALTYLLLYNTVFVLPLILIALAVVVGQRFVAEIDIAVVRLSPYRRYIDLLIGLVLIAAGLYILLH